MSNFFHRWDDIQKLKAGTMVAPHFVDMHICYTCNQHCVGCAYDGMLSTKMMSRDQAFNAVAQFMDVGVKAFDFAGGGEPLVPPYMADLMNYIGERGGRIGLITNGTLLKGAVLDAMLKFGTYIRVSMEASNPDDYRRYKVVPDDGHWNTVLENVRRAIGRRNTEGSRLEVSMKFAVGRDLRGVCHYADGIALGHSCGVDQITFKALRHEPQELSVDDKRIEDRTLKNFLAASGDSNVKFWIAPASINDVAQCWLNQLHTVIDYEGNVYICCYYYYRKDAHLLGNLFEKPFKDFWFSKDHSVKVAAISRHECHKVDCKFFKHHADYNAAERGMLNFM